MNIATVGIDLAKNIFAVHGVDDNGKPVLVKPKVQRAEWLPLIAIKGTGVELFLMKVTWCGTPANAVLDSRGISEG